MHHYRMFVLESLLPGRTGHPRFTAKRGSSSLGRLHGIRQTKTCNLRGLCLPTLSTGSHPMMFGRSGLHYTSHPAAFQSSHFLSVKSAVQGRVTAIHTPLPDSQEPPFFYDIAAAGRNRGGRDEQAGRCSGRRWAGDPRDLATCRSWSSSLRDTTTTSAHDGQPSIRTGRCNLFNPCNLPYQTDSIYPQTYPR